jgi:hypothetical protein
MNIDSWLGSAIADAERRGLPELKPLLEMLARSTLALRRADDEVRAAEAPAVPSGSDGPSRS